MIIRISYSHLFIKVVVCLTFMDIPNGRTVGVGK